MSALIAHPAAAVPFTRSGLYLSALIIGSISPDFLYFFQRSTNNPFGHTLPGFFLFSLPAGLAALWVFHVVLKHPLFTLFPTSHQARLFPLIDKFTGFSSGKRLFLSVASLLVGAGTHLLWDACTHVDGRIVQRIALLRFPLVVTSQGTLYVYKGLQEGGLICGTLLLATWYWRWFIKAPTHAVPRVLHMPDVTKMLITAFLLGIASLLGIAYGLSKVPTLHTVKSFSDFVIFSGKASFASGWAGILVFSIGWYAVNYAKYRRFRKESL